jgi:hypothetical protein
MFQRPVPKPFKDLSLILKVREVTDEGHEMLASSRKNDVFVVYRAALG